MFSDVFPLPSHCVSLTLNMIARQYSQVREERMLRDRAFQNAENEYNGYIYISRSLHKNSLSTSHTNNIICLSLNGIYHNMDVIANNTVILTKSMIKGGKRSTWKVNMEKLA